MNSVAYTHIVDDEPDVLRTLVFLLASAGIAAMTYRSAEHLLAATASLPAGCILTDVRMPGIGGLALVERLKTEAPDHPVIVMSGHADLELVIQSMRAGAADFLVKPFGKEALIERVTSALLTGSQVAAQGEDVSNYKRVFETLTPRQRQILSGIMEGKLNKTMATELGISERTVEVHRADIMRKTRAPRSGALVRMAMLAGI